LCGKQRAYEYEPRYEQQFFFLEWDPSKNTPGAGLCAKPKANYILKTVVWELPDIVKEELL
jgi:hypothetical protein